VPYSAPSPGEKHVLLFSPFFYPELISTGRYNSYLAESLVSCGVTLDVVASHPLFPTWKIHPSDALLPGMRIHRGGRWLTYPNSPLLRRALLEFWFCFHTLKFWILFLSKKRLRRLPRQSLVVVPVFPPSLFFALLSYLLPSSLPRVGLVHDLQGVYADNGGTIHRLIGRLIKSVEHRAFHACDCLVFLSNSMMSRAISAYDLDPTRCSVSHPFITLSKALSDSPLIDLAFNDSQHNVVYSGALGDKQQPDLLLSFFGALQQRAPFIRCHIFSAGPHLKRLEQDAARLNVALHDLVPSCDLATLYERSSVQVIPQAFGTADGSLPSKLPNLLAAGVPVFVICEHGSEVGTLIQSLDAGAISTSWDIDTLVDTFMTAWPLLISESHDHRRARLSQSLSDLFSLDSVVHQITRYFS
jgi:hypothetical protein